MADLESPLWAFASAGMRASRILKRMIERSKLYLYYIVEEVEKRGMPTEIALLPMVERVQSHGVFALARLRPVAIHSFDRQDLQAEPELVGDSRRDVVASTMPALDYLQALYELHGDWHLALASITTVKTVWRARSNETARRACRPIT